MKSLQILQSVAEFHKKVKSLRMLQSLQIWQNFYKCGRICSPFKYCRVLKIVQMLQPFKKKTKDRNKKMLCCRANSDGRIFKMLQSFINIKK